MKKFENWNEEYKDASEVVGFEQIPVGPQIVEILKVEDIAEKEYLKIAFDIADGKYKGFFRRIFDADTRADKKWPNSGITYRSYKKSADRFFMAFIKALDKSNDKFNGTTWDWNEKKLVGLKFVANFAEEEYISENEIKVSVKCAEVRSIQALTEGNIKNIERKCLPDEDKEYYEDKKQNIEVTEDDLPF